jgi:RNA polymerase sigma-70 factor, ECF subfamily
MKAGDEEQAVGAEALRVEAKGEAEQDVAAQAAVQRPRASGDDEDVVQAIAQGDLKAALGLCIRRHGEAMGRLCMALMGSQADAEDVLQETLLDAYRGLEGWRNEGSVRSWLFGIARRKCAREMERGLRRRSKLRLVGEEPASSTRGAEQSLAVRRRAEQARAALGELRPSEREAVVLRFGGDLSFREVAEACGIDEAAARKRVSRGLAALRSSLEEE